MQNSGITTPAARPSLASVTASGMRWTLLGSVATLAVQLPYAAIMSRLLSPRDFGLMGLALFMVRFVAFFAQSGLSSAVTQRPVLEARDVRAAMASGIAIGLGGYAVAWAITPFAVRVVHGPAELTSVCRALALTFVLSAVGSTATGLLRRAMRHRAITVVEFGSYVIGYCGIGVMSAVTGHGVWSLVHACLGQSALMMTCCCAVAGQDLRPLFDLRAMRDVASVGAKVSFIGFLEFLTMSGDNILIGRYEGVETLGHYNRAWFLASLPLLQVAMALNKVMVPAFSCIQAETERLKRAYSDSITMTTLLFVPMAAVIAASSESAVHVVLGAEWPTAAELVPVLAAASALSVITYLPAAVAEATGCVRRRVTIEVVHLAALLVGTGIAVSAGTGITGLVTAVLMSRLARHLLYLVCMGRVLPGSLWRAVRAHAQSAMLGVAVWLAVTTVGRATEGSVPPLVVLTVQLCTAGLLGILVLRYGRRLKGVRVACRRGLVPRCLRRAG